MANEGTVSKIQVQEPLHTGLQQPTVEPNSKGKGIALEKNANQNEPNLKGKAIAFEEGHDIGQNNATPQPTQAAEEIVYDAIPISSVVPEGFDYDKYGIPKQYHYKVYKNEDSGDKNMVLTKSDRQRNWYIQERPRQSGISRQCGVIDKFYIHLKSNLQCRSLTEVYNFIEYGKKNIKQPAVGDNGDASVVKRQKGSSLIESVEVGYYIYSENIICRKIPTGPQTNAETPESAKKGRKRRRRRVIGNSINSENQTQDATFTTAIKRLHVPVYDFVPLK